MQCQHAAYLCLHVTNLRYSNLKDNNVDRRLIYVNMQNNYIDMQHICYILYKINKLHVNIIIEPVSINLMCM